MLNKISKSQRLQINANRALFVRQLFMFENQQIETFTAKLFTNLFRYCA